MHLQSTGLLRQPSTSRSFAPAIHLQSIGLLRQPSTSRSSCSNIRLLSLVSLLVPHHSRVARAARAGVEQKNSTLIFPALLHPGEETTLYDNRREDAPSDTQGCTANRVSPSPEAPTPYQRCLNSESWFLDVESPWIPYHARGLTVRVLIYCYAVRSDSSQKTWAER